VQRIYVGNIGHHNTEQNVQSAFEIYGKVEKVDIIAGFALVDMANPSDAAKAIAELNSVTGWYLCALPCSVGKAA